MSAAPFSNTCICVIPILTYSCLVWLITLAELFFTKSGQNLNSNRIRIFTNYCHIYYIMVLFQFLWVITVFFLLHLLTCSKYIRNINEIGWRVIFLILYSASSACIDTELVLMSYIGLSFFRKCPAGESVKAFTPSACQEDPALLMKLTDPAFCGLYLGAGSGVDIFADCRTTNPDMATSFYDFCVYDFCENSLTTTDSFTFSGCYADGGGKLV